MFCFMAATCTCTCMCTYHAVCVCVLEVWSCTCIVTLINDVVTLASAVITRLVDKLIGEFIFVLLYLLYDPHHWGGEEQR